MKLYYFKSVLDEEQSSNRILTKANIHFFRNSLCNRHSSYSSRLIFPEPVSPTNTIHWLFFKRLINSSLYSNTGVNGKLVLLFVLCDVRINYIKASFRHDDGVRVNAKLIHVYLTECLEIVEIKSSEPKQFIYGRKRTNEEDSQTTDDAQKTTNISVKSLKSAKSTPLNTLTKQHLRVKR
ncbi:hypothetical protein AGLY_013073 [Aphis glycines]|uniref:Uncharacterized protein n=1 Tax=Aphis glycines TaxID=307491 RepID=A0A6G0T8Z8_APHGL|nr:hypothetical protein AGLY_013073 [Aphis glycines]